MCATDTVPSGPAASKRGRTVAGGAGRFEGAVRDGHSLGASGGTGGVEHVGQVFGGRSAVCQGRVGHAGTGCQQRIDIQGPRTLGAVVTCRRSAGDHDGGSAVLEDDPDPLLRVGEVHRDVDRARGQHRQCGSDDVGRARQGHGHPVAGLHSGGQQSLGEGLIQPWGKRSWRQPAAGSVDEGWRVGVRATWPEGVDNGFRAVPARRRNSAKALLRACRCCSGLDPEPVG
jgi:hypothetical protein